MVSIPERAPAPTVPAGQTNARPPAIAEQLTSAPPAQSTAAVTFLDATTAFEGVIRSSEPLRLDGCVKGEIHCESSVAIGESARIEAMIRADAVVIAGEVRGEVHAGRKITLAATARVVGELTTPGIVIEDGAELVGRIQIGARAATSEPQPERKAPSGDLPRDNRPAPPAVTPAPTA